MKGIVMREYYQIVHYVAYSKTEPLTGELPYSADLYYEAFRLCAERKEMVAIQRVTEYRIDKAEADDPFLMLMADVTDAGDYYTGTAVTGRRVIQPEHFATDVELSRYTPVNGWTIPETIEVYQ